ncbi:MAG: hypothetical protein IAE82_00710, partial [Opitutaceae bacterium]|nr:hypothetical protein [Opitutaceae bacterium]
MHLRPTQRPHHRWFSSGLLAAWLVATSAPCLHALDPLRRAGDYTFAAWNTSHGLPYTAVRSLHQDPRGYLWVATRGGLARFDGVRLVAFTQDTTPELGDGEVHTVASDADGTLWIATNHGIVWHLDDRWWRPEQLSALRDQAVTWLEHDGATTWIVTTTGVLTYREGRLGPAPLPAGIEFQNLRAVVRRGADELIILAEPSWHIRGNEAARIIREDGTWHSWIYCAIPHPEYGWLLGSDNGLFALVDDVARRIPHLGGLGVSSGRSLLLDRAGTLWIGTRGELLRHTPERTEVVEKPGIDSIGNYLCLFEDREGNLWGGNDSGLTRFGDVRASFLGTVDGLPGRSVVSMLTARDGSIWAGIWGGGLAQFSRGGRLVRSYRTADGLPGDAVRNICEAPDGALWVSFLNETVARFQDGMITRLDQRPLTTNRAHDMVCDRRGTVWLSTFDHGLVRLAEGRAGTVKLPEGVFVAALLIDTQDRLWVAWRGGFGRPDTVSGRWIEHYAHAAGTGGIPVDMIEDARGDIWVFREGMTIERLHAGAVQTVMLPQRVGRLTYSALVHGTDLWVNFRNGIARIPIAEFEAAAVTGAEPRFTLLREADGLRSVAPNVYTGSGATAGPDGRLYFATSRGIAVVDPARVRTPDTPPPIVFEELVVDKVVHHPATLDAIRPGRGEVEIHYSALALANAELNQFRHRLLPIEKAWTAPGAERVAYYGGLRPGEYRFELLAANADGVWTPEPAVLVLRLPPHFHQTWWFAVLVALAVPSAVWLLVRRREAALRQDKHRLEEGIAARTLELHESNRKLTLQVQETARKAAALQEGEERIRRLNEELESRVAARTAELHAVNRELESFAYSVSHDLRAPLRGIDGWSLAILEDHGDKLDASILAHLQRVRAEAQRLGHLIDELLQLSRTTRAELTFTAIDLSGLATAVAQRVAGTRPHTDVTFTCQPGLRTRGDITLLEGALFNLIDNAWKFSAHTEHPRVEFGLTDTDRGPAFFVRDNGAGFDMRHARRLFGVFQRLHNQQEFPGTGVGLATVHRIVQRHGGTIWAESAPGRGATFY